MKKSSNFPATLILFKINFGWFSEGKSCYFNIFEGFQFWFLKISHLKISKIPKNLKFSAAQMVKIGSFWSFKLTQIDFTQNLSGRAILKFQHSVFPIRLPRSVHPVILKKLKKACLPWCFEQIWLSWKANCEANVRNGMWGH